MEEGRQSRDMGEGFGGGVEEKKKGKQDKIGSRGGGSTGQFWRDGGRGGGVSPDGTQSSRTELNRHFGLSGVRKGGRKKHKGEKRTD